MDAGIIIFSLSPSGTAFAVGLTTYFGDIKTRNHLLKTAEIAGPDDFVLKDNFPSAVLDGGRLTDI